MDYDEETDIFVRNLFHPRSVIDVEDVSQFYSRSVTNRSENDFTPQSQTTLTDFRSEIPSVSVNQTISTAIPYEESSYPTDSTEEYSDESYLEKPMEEKTAITSQSSESNEMENHDSIEWEEITLPFDSYSFVFTKGEHIDFRIIIFSVVVCAIQAVILSLILMDLLDYEDGNPWPNPPVDVSPFMRCAQFLAIMFAIATQDDMTEALNFIICIFETPKPDKSNRKKDFIFLISCFGKLCIGFMTLIVSLIIVLQSDKVIDLFADFAGMFFVSQVDNIMFIMAEGGYMWEFLHDRAKELKATTIRKPKIRFNLIRFMTMNIISAAMLGVCGRIATLQMKGKFFTQDISFFIGDDAHQLYPLLNGHYTWNNERKAQRPVYLREQCGMGCQLCCAAIIYCSKDHAWTLIANVNLEDPCGFFLAKSERTEVFDPMDVPSSGWRVFDIQSRIEISSRITRITDNECSLNDHCFSHGKCNTETNKCECQPGRLGTRCEGPIPCDVIEVDIAKGRFPGIAETFHLLRDETDSILTLYTDRPVYYYDMDTYIHLILYYGSRWVMTTTLVNSHFQALDEEYTVNDLISYFKQFTSDSWTDFQTIDYISEQTESFSPVGIPWNRWLTSGLANRVVDQKSLGTLERVNAIFLCGSCKKDQTNACSFNGECQENRCKCNEGYHGVNCHLPLVRGKVDIFFDPGDPFPCGSCLEYELIFDTPNNGSYCTTNNNFFSSPVLLTDKRVARKIAFDMNATHFLVYVMDDGMELCENGKLISATERHSTGRMVKYKDVFEITATGARSGFVSDYCSRRFEVEPFICVQSKFSSYSEEQMVARFFVRIDAIIAAQQDTSLFTH